VKVLASSGRSVTVLDLNELSLSPLPGNIKFIKGDYNDKKILDTLIKCDVDVIHLASASTPNTSFDHPLLDLNQNLSPLHDLLSISAACGSLFVFISSGGAVYGEANYLPIDELHPTRPISSYGITKLTIENYIHLYSLTHGLKYICIRPSNAFGVGQKPFSGQGFISTCIGMVMRGESVNIYGIEGTVRDYIYVTDLAEAIEKIVNSGVINETYNVGSGVGLSNIDVVNAARPLLNSLGFEVNVKYLPSRLSDVRSNVLDSSKLTEQTGWKQRIQFIDGLNEVTNWIKNF
jgi:UDP-glucose 4-epimerase